MSGKRKRVISAFPLHGIRSKNCKFINIFFAPMILRIDILGAMRYLQKALLREAAKKRGPATKALTPPPPRAYWQNDAPTKKK